MDLTHDILILTINGKAELVVQDAASYQKLLQVAQDPRIFDGIRAGQGRPLGEVFDQIHNNLKISS